MSASVAPGVLRNRYVANGVELAVDIQFDQSVSMEPLYSAIALGEQDALLQCLSDWLGEDFDWRQHDKTTVPLPLDITLSSRANPDHKIGLAFSNGTDSLPLFPDVLNEVAALHAHTKVVSICLTELQLSQHDEEKLMPGSCLLLPETFRPVCHVGILDVHSRLLLVGATLDLKQQSISHCSVTTLSKEDLSVSPVTRVVLCESIDIDFQHWNSGSTINLRSLIGQAVLVEVGGVQSYSATLIQVGVGLAALIDEPSWT